MKKARLPTEVSSMKKASTCDGNVFFPENLLFLILAWLPVMSILRFKSVCKSWYALIESSSFINQHLRCHIHYNNSSIDNHDDKNFLVLNVTHPAFASKYDKLKFSLLRGENFEFSKEIEFPGHPSASFLDLRMVTCNGIVCLFYQDLLLDENFGHDYKCVWDLFLWNPATKQTRALPQPPVAPHGIAYFGFGFDTENDDYKVVLFSTFDITRDASHNVIKRHCHVYSLRTDDWTTLDFSLPIDGLYSSPEEYFENSICINEQILFHYIISFDFSKEVFEVTPLPDNYSLRYSCWPDFPIETAYTAFIHDAVHYPHMILVSQPEDERNFEIWMLNENGVKETWTKLYTVGPLLHTRPIGILKNGKYLLLEMGKHLCIYNAVTQEIKSLRAQENALFEWEESTNLLGVAAYKESLVSVKGGTIHG